MQNATPATSVVVDLKTRKFTDEVTATAGCWSIIVPPSRARLRQHLRRRRAADRGPGRQRQPSGQQRSKPLFDVEKDPIFTHTENVGDTFYFVSYQGNVYSADIGAKDVTLGESWSLLDKSGKDRGWRPGGYNLLAVNRANKRLYVGMHPNGAEGTHKTPAAEIWVYDLTTRKRVARIPGQGALSMSVSQDDKPRLFTIDGGNVNVYDAAPVAPVLKGAIRARARRRCRSSRSPGGSREMTDPVLFYSASAALAACCCWARWTSSATCPASPPPCRPTRSCRPASARRSRCCSPWRKSRRRAAADARVAAGGAGLALLVLATATAGLAFNLARPPRHGLRLLRSDVAPARRARHRTVLVAGGAQRGAGGLDRAGAGAPACRAACCGRTPRRCSAWPPAPSPCTSRPTTCWLRISLQAI